MYSIYYRCKGTAWFLLLNLSFWAFSSCGTDLPSEVQVAYEALPETVDFNYHIRPILADRCWSCHGPDANAREANLRLDTEEDAFAALSNGEGKPFVDGNINRSVAFQRMISDDPERQMPPPASNLSLSAEEIALIAKWIDQGAEWKKHWAFIPPEKPASRVNSQQDWKQYNEIDAFVQQKLVAADLSPAPQADKQRLIRRVTQDLTGLPPTLPDIDAFLADESANAYEKVVDRLLQSEAYAERMAMEWLDVARYADSHGMHADGWRMMWPWRDWVISAFQENMPYDEFVTMQMAGDLFPEPTRESKLATAFHRNHPMTAEGGAIEEEFRLEYVFDRANTVSTAILGLTMECAKCHDHKFDPISQQEYYQFASFFNNVRDLGMTGDDGNYGPMLVLTDEEEQKTIDEIDELLASMVSDWETNIANIDEVAGYISTLQEKPLIGGRFEQRSRRIDNGRGYTAFDGNRKVVSGAEHPLVEGKNGTGLAFTGVYDAVNLKIDPFRETDAFSGMAWVNSTKRKKNQTQTIMGTTGTKNSFWRGWEFYLDSMNIPAVRLIHSLPHNLIHVSALDSIQINEWTHIAFSYDGSMQAEGVSIFVDGKKVPVRIDLNKLTGDIQPVSDGTHEEYKKPVQVARSGRAYTGEDGNFKGRMDDVFLYKTDLTATEVAIQAGFLKADATASSQQVDWKYVSMRRSQAFRQFRQRRNNLLTKRVKMLQNVPEVMVMEELPIARTMHILNRGQYDQPLDPVEPGTPLAVLDFGPNYPVNRLGLSHWLFSENNPLTARVAVNRYWQMIFGTGLVATAHDFGNQGKLPTHPELLDWLAVEFWESDWDVRALLKQMVMSYTYRQESRMTPELQLHDPDNKLLARGPSHRLQAEMIRDHGLLASGLLTPKIGGESVRPYQPEGLWLEKSNFSHMLMEYEPDEGDNLYRRSMYTFIRRSSPPPFMNIFDAPSRDRCTIQREVTNTPLQALVLLNDPQFIEISRVLAQNLLKDTEGDLETKIKTGFRKITSRQPTADELAIYQKMYQAEWANFQENPQKAKEFVSVGEYPVDDTLDLSELAAMAMVTHTMLNQDEAFMKR